MFDFLMSIGSFNYFFSSIFYRCGGRRQVSWRCSWLTTVSSRRTWSATKRTGTSCSTSFARTRRVWRKWWWICRNLWYWAFIISPPPKILNHVSLIFRAIDDLPLNISRPYAAASESDDVVEIKEESNGFDLFRSSEGPSQAACDPGLSAGEAGAAVKSEAEALSSECDAAGRFSEAPVEGEGDNYCISFVSVEDFLTRRLLSN